MSSYTVRVTFLKDGSGYTPYTLPLIQDIEDPEPSMKETEIDGTRGDGTIVIPGGKKSQTIKINGLLYDDDYDFVSISTAMAAMRTALTTDTGTLTLEYYASGAWHTVWTFTVRRLSEINFPPSLRVDSQKYEVSFKVLTY